MLSAFTSASIRVNSTIYAASGARANIALNTAYVHLTSGNAIALRYMANTADTIDELYVFTDLTTGTRGNISLACDIYNEGSVALRPGSTLRDSATAVSYPAGDDQWVKITFGTPYTPSIGEVLWFVIYSTASAPATDYPSIMSATNTVIGLANRASGVSTTDGFSTNGTGQTEMPFVVKQGANYIGNPIIGAASFFANNTRKRGIVVTPPATIQLLDIESSSAQTTALTGIQIFTSDQAPGDTPVYSYALGSTAGQTTDEVIGAKILSDYPTLNAGTTYYIVYTFAVNTTTPSGGVIEDYASYSTVFDALFDDFGVCAAVQDDGANGWTISRNFIPNMVGYIYGITGAGASWTIALV